MQEGVGAFAWGLMDKSNSSHMLLKSHAPVYGPPEQTHSTRGEIFGLLADYTNSIWQYRSEMVHKAKETSCESMIRSNALELFFELRRDPYQLPYAARDLAHHTKTSILNVPLSKLKSWITRIHNTIDLQTSRMKFGTSDIRDWLSHKHVPNSSDDDDDDGFYMSGDTPDMYDSDDTINFSERCPDELSSLDT